MSGRYDETESLWLLPAFMRADAFDAEMSEIVDEFGRDVSAATRTYSVWDAIDKLDGPALDALAEELNIIWYDKTASLAARRGVVKNCKRIQAKLGTKWALEEILGIYFTGGAIVTEWFDYPEGPGDPNHFRVEAEYLSGTADDTARFLAVLSQVKRKSAILDGVIAVIGGNCVCQPYIWPQGRRVDHINARRDD